MLGSLRSEALILLEADDLRSTLELSDKSMGYLVSAAVEMASKSNKLSAFALAG
jgi:hypothetical protein